VAGYLTVAGVFIKYLSSKNRFRVFNAYGIDDEVMDQLLAGKCRKIIIRETDTGKEYSISMDDFLDESFEEDYEGNGLRHYLPLEHWNHGVFFDDEAA